MIPLLCSGLVALHINRSYRSSRYEHFQEPWFSVRWNTDSCSRRKQTKVADTLVLSSADYVSDVSAGQLRRKSYAIIAAVLLALDG